MHETGSLEQSGNESKIEQTTMKLLVAEDSDDNRFLIAAYLKERPYELTFVQNGREALEMFASREFDLVLMDIQMPVMDGLAAAEAIRTLERGRSARSTPILALTANALAEDAVRSQAAGCDRHLSKPVSKLKLIEAIESFRLLPAAPENTKDPGAHYVIEIPCDFEELSRNYIVKRRKEIARMMALPFSDPALDELRVLGHNMKGTGVSFGFPDLTHLGAAIEKAAKAGDMSGLAANLVKTNAYLDYAAATLRIEL